MSSHRHGSFKSAAEAVLHDPQKADVVASIHRSLEEIKRLHPCAHDRFMRVQTLCNEAWLKCYNDMTTGFVMLCYLISMACVSMCLNIVPTTAFEKCFMGSSLPNRIIHAIRDEYLVYPTIDDAALIKIASDTMPTMTLVKESLRGLLFACFLNEVFIICIDMDNVHVAIPTSEVYRKYPPSTHIYLDSLRTFNKLIESRIDAGDMYVCVQSDGITEPIPEKRDAILFELHACRRHQMSCCGRIGCTATRFRSLHQSSSPPMPLFQRCGSCAAVTYCSAACQKQDWAGHKTVCTPASKRAVLEVYKLLAAGCPGIHFRYSPNDYRLSVTPANTASLQRIDKMAQQTARHLATSAVATTTT